MIDPKPRKFIPQTTQISRELICKPGGSTADLAILVFVMTRTSPASSANDKIVQMWDILLRFPEDNAVQLALAVKRLQKKGLLDAAPKINIDIPELMEQIYNIKVS